MSTLVAGGGGGGGGSHLKWPIIRPELTVQLCVHKLKSKFKWGPLEWELVVGTERSDEQANQAARLTGLVLSKGIGGHAHFTIG